jgi:hypothetical protein
MSISVLLGITPWPALSALVWFVAAVAGLYLMRDTAHQAIRTTTDALSRGLRLASHSIARGETRLATRNREVLLAAGREAKERIVERVSTLSSSSVVQFFVSALVMVGLR